MCACVRESACLCVRVCELVCVCAHMCVYERENLSREREREGARENEPLSRSLICVLVKSLLIFWDIFL